MKIEIKFKERFLHIEFDNSGELYCFYAKTHYKGYDELTSEDLNGNCHVNEDKSCTRFYIDLEKLMEVKEI